MNMKKIYFTLFFVALCRLLYSQDYVIINDPVYGGFELPFQDTTLTSVDETGQCYMHDQYYYFDLDNDSSADIMFKLHCFSAGPGDESQIKIKSLGNFQTIADTGYLAYGQYWDDNTQQIRDTLYPYTIPYKFMEGDTITAGMVTSTDLIYMDAEDYGNDPPIIYLRIDRFRGDTSYIAFYKNDGANTWIYYMKVHVPWETRIHLMKAYANDLELGVGETYQSPDYIYPNPVSSKAVITGGFEHIEIYSLQGRLLYSENISGNHTTLDLSWLPAGLYMAKLRNRNSEVVQKIIKN